MITDFFLWEGFCVIFLVQNSPKRLKFMWILSNVCINCVKSGGGHKSETLHYVLFEWSLLTVFVPCIHRKLNLFHDTREKHVPQPQFENFKNCSRLDHNQKLPHKNLPPINLNWKLQITQNPNIYNKISSTNWIT